MAPESDLQLLRLGTSLAVGIAVLLGILGLYAWFRYREQLRRTVERSQQVGADPIALEALRRRRSLFLQWSDRYDQTRHARRVREQLVRADIKITPAEYQATRLFLAIAVFWINLFFVRINNLIAIPVAILAAVAIPRWFLNARRGRYITIFDTQLIEAAAAMSSAVRAGLSIPQAIALMARKLPAPAREEFNQLSREINLLGVSVEAALYNMLDRLPSDDLSVMVTTILIQRQAGGDLVRALSQLSDTMRDRRRLHDEVHTMTAEARFSSYVIMAMPVIILLFMRNTMPEMVEQLFEHPIGWTALAIFAGLQVVGFVLVRRIADIKV